LSVPTDDSPDQPPVSSSSIVLRHRTGARIMSCSIDLVVLKMLPPMRV
jgi:hypothetical protein